MYAFMEGLLEEKGPDYVVVNCGGVGYLLFVSNNTLGALGPTGEPARLYTNLQVREDSMTLYGFFSKPERQMFERLISVSGVGPKVAMAVLSSMQPDKLALSIIAGDEKEFSKVPGIGKKTAQRIILELKEKIDTQEAVAGSTGLPSDPGDSMQQEAVAALAALGYGPSEAALAVANVSGSAQDVSELITLALKQFARK
jgi:Holliday junction DNA helicase RuvA